MEPLDLEIVQSTPQVIAPIEVKPAFTLLPTVPSTVTNYAPTGKAKINEGELLSHFLANRKTDKAGELYNYSTAQEERYDNPYEQFTPNIQGSTTSEDLYGKQQGAGEQLYHSLVKFGATTGATFLSGFTAIPRQIDAIRQGDAAALFESDSVFGETQKWLEEVENKFPNYQTQVEQDRSWIVNAFTPTGAANFWGDTILKNAGFTVGAIANALVVDAAIEIGSGGTATAPTLILAGKQLSNAMKPLKAVYRKLSRSSALGVVDDVIGVANASKSTVGAIEVANSAWNLKKGSQFVATTYMMSQGEAMIEGYHTYIDTKTQLLEQADAAGKQLTPELLDGIEQSASAAGKTTAMFNTAILAASYFVQFPKILGWTGGSDLLEKVGGRYLGISGKAATATEEAVAGGLRAANTYSRKEAIKEVLKDFALKGFVSEGAEEGEQYYIGNTLHDYYIDKFNGDSQKGMADYMTSAIPKTLADANFWHEVVIGGISGMITGAAMPGGELQHSLKSNLFGAKAKNDQYVSNIQETLDKLNDNIAELTNLDETLAHRGSRPSTKFQTAYKSLHRAVTTAAKYGSLDNLKAGLNDLKNLPLDEYNKTFFEDPTQGLKTENEKVRSIRKIEQEVKSIENDAIQIEKTHKLNPFSTKHVRDVLAKKFKVDRTNLAGAEQKLFEDWKQNQTFLVGRMRQTRGRVADIQDDMKLGSNTQSEEEFSALYSTLTAIGNSDALSTYASYKNNQIRALKIEEEYYQSMGDKLKEKEIRNNIDRIQTLYDKILPLVGKDKGNEITALLMDEEFTQGQIIDMMARVEEAREAESIIANSEDELVTNVDNPEHSANTMVAAVEALKETEEAINPQVTSVPVSIGLDRIDYWDSYVPSDVRIPALEPVPEMGNAVYNQLRELNPGTKVEFGGMTLTVLASTETVVRTNQISFLPEGWVVLGESEVQSYKDYRFKVLTEHTPLVSSNRVATNEAMRKEFDAMKAGKELVSEPNKVGGKYIQKGARFMDGYVYWIKEEKGFRKITVNKDGRIIAPETVTFDNPTKFYSIDGEVVIVIPEAEKPVEVVNPIALEVVTPEPVIDLVEEPAIVPKAVVAEIAPTEVATVVQEPEVSMPLETAPVVIEKPVEKVVEAKKEEVADTKPLSNSSTVEEKINSFMGSNANVGLKNVILSQINNGLINIQC